MGENENGWGNRAQHRWPGSNTGALVLSRTVLQRQVFTKRQVLYWYLSKTLGIHIAV